jgi:excisionase family DNA binding protein
VTADEAVYTMPEIAGMLRVDVRTVKNLIRRGELRRLKVGRSVRIAESQYADYLKSAEK